MYLPTHSKHTATIVFRRCVFGCLLFKPANILVCRPCTSLYFCIFVFLFWRNRTTLTEAHVDRSANAVRQFTNPVSRGSEMTRLFLTAPEPRGPVPAKYNRGQNTRMYSPMSAQAEPAMNTLSPGQTSRKCHGSGRSSVY